MDSSTPTNNDHAPKEPARTGAKDARAEEAPTATDTALPVDQDDTSSSLPKGQEQANASPSPSSLPEGQEEANARPSPPSLEDQKEIAPSPSSLEGQEEAGVPSPASLEDQEKNSLEENAPSPPSQLEGQEDANAPSHETDNASSLAPAPASIETLVVSSQPVQAETEKGEEIPPPLPTTEQESAPARGNSGESQPTEGETLQSVAPPDHEQQIAWLQKELHAAHTLIMQLQNKEGDDLLNPESRASDQMMVELQTNLHQQMAARAEAEHELKSTKASLEALEQELRANQQEATDKIQALERNLSQLVEEKNALKEQLVTRTAEREDQARTEAALMMRLNDAKKQQGLKVNEAKHFQQEAQLLESELEACSKKLEQATAEAKQWKNQYQESKEAATQRIEQLQQALTGERKLNEDRKQKMMSAVDEKTKEWQSLVDENAGLKTELEQTNLSLRDVDERMKKLHAQWLQSQTHNRELQREINKMRQDSEKLSKVGKTLEMKLSRSTQETKEHLNKRVTAKNELMSVLKQLEAERDLQARLRECIKFTFIPKALSQQQLISESLSYFETLLGKLSLSLRQPLPPPSSGSSYMDSTPDNGNTLLNISDESAMTATEKEAAMLLAKLEHESQKVSQHVLEFQANLDRMSSMMTAASPRGCLAAFLSATTARMANSSEQEERSSMVASPGGTRSSGYGQVPTSTALT